MSQRVAYILCLLTVFVILGSGIYLQYVEGILPCPLCTLQRICFGISGFLFLLGAMLNRRRIARMSVTFLNIISSGLGMMFAGRQIWIQLHPNLVNTECGVSIQYLLKILSVREVAEKIYSGGTECAQRGWEFLTLSIPEWSLLFFTCFLIVNFYYFISDYQTR